MNVSGRWEGKLLDMTGPAALLELNLKSSGGRVAGDFAVSFVSSDEAGCSGPTRRLAQVGPVSGKFDAKGNRVQLSYDITIGLEPVAVAFEGVMTNADPHARRALVGSYSVGKGAGQLTLEGGACVLWLFAGQEQRR